ncbi:Uncharacterised protein [Achromobacter xylosoxidans]|nr:Uncharacterised protein [Achromobacter xylosoxidans]
MAPTNGAYTCGAGAAAASAGAAPASPLAGAAGAAATAGAGTSPPRAAGVFSGGRLAASEDVARPFTYSVTRLPSAVTARCCQAAGVSDWPGWLRWPFTSTKGTPWLMPISSALPASRRAYTSCSPAGWSARTQALKLKAPAAGTASEGLAGSISGAPPANCAARPITPSTAAAMGVWALLLLPVVSRGGAPAALSKW